MAALFIKPFNASIRYTKSSFLLVGSRPMSIATPTSSHETWKQQNQQQQMTSLTNSLMTMSLRDFGVSASANFRTSLANNSGRVQLPPDLPKRSPNVFALFVKDNFKKLPSDMPLKEKFAKSAEIWHTMTDEQKEDYKRQMTDKLITYRQQMSAYLERLSPEALEELKKLKKEKIKEKTRIRIKHKLRKLNYPKRSCSAYIFYVRHHLKQKYPDGNYPPVRSPEHLQFVGTLGKNWKTMSKEDRIPFMEQAEQDRARYFTELEQWKQDLAKPENEQCLLQLERLTRKINNANKSEEEVKKRQAKVAAKVIKARVAKKNKKLDQIKKKAKNSTKAKTVKKSSATKTSSSKKSNTIDNDDGL